MDYSSLALQFLHFQCIQRVPYIVLQWGNGRCERYRGIWKAKRQVIQIHIKENSKNIWPFAHILMYMGLRVISAYIREKGIKSCIQKIMSVFRDDIGNIKVIK